MEDQLVKALDRRIRQILNGAYERASYLANAYKAETGRDHPLVFNQGMNGVTKQASRPTRAKAGRKKRERRTPDQLQKEALSIVELVKSRGKDGADGKAIRSSFPKVGQSIKDFVKRYGKARLQTQGTGVGMRYFSAKD
jgi:hypothetical protein